MNDYYQFRNETGTPIDYYQLVNDNNELCKEIERLHSIIKEVREYIEKHIEEEYKYDGLLYENEQKKELLEILEESDKE